MSILEYIGFLANLIYILVYVYEKSEGAPSVSSYKYFDLHISFRNFLLHY